MGLASCPLCRSRCRPCSGSRPHPSCRPRCCSGRSCRPVRTSSASGAWRRSRTEAVLCISIFWNNLFSYNCFNLKILKKLLKLHKNRSSWLPSLTPRFDSHWEYIFSLFELLLFIYMIIPLNESLLKVGKFKWSFILSFNCQHWIEAQPLSNPSLLLIIQLFHEKCFN